MTRALLTIGTGNRGDHAKFKAIHEACLKSVATCLQEMHDQTQTLHDLKAEGLGVWIGDRKDSWSDPVVWQPELLDVHDMWSVPLLPERTISGVHNQAKTLNAVRGTHIASRRTIIVASCHNIQYQWMPGRKKPATQFNRNVVEALGDLTRTRFVGADNNAKWTGDSWAPMRKAGWTSSQQKGQQVKKKIDAVAWIDRANDEPIVQYRSKATFPISGSDHLLHQASFGILVRP